MTKFPIAAVALLLGTSAYAMVPSTQPTGVVVDKDPHVVTGMTEAASATYAYDVRPASADWWGAAEPVAYTPVAYSSEDMKAADFAANDEAVDDGIDAAADEEPALEAAVAEVEPASYETTAIDEEPVPIESGVGGPDELAAADASPRPAAQNYPACRPGRGDDNCIQLYEPGVRQQLASWDQPTGGFAGAGETQVAMGGPYEPTDSASETERLNQQALADSTAALQSVQMAAAEPAEAADESLIETAEADAQDMALVQQASLDEESDTVLDESLDDEKPIEV